MGYRRAGFSVVGNDFRPMPEYPFELIVGDWLDVLNEHAHEFDVIHASPPCKGYSGVNTRTESVWAREVPRVRKALRATGKPYVIENVLDARAHMVRPVQLCGSSFGLRVRRHRLFESNVPIAGVPCDHGWQNASKVYTRRGHWSKPVPTGVCPVNGESKQLLGVTTDEELALRRAAMGIDWMSWHPLTQAIPPVYTQLIGSQVLDAISRQAATSSTASAARARVPERAAAVRTRAVAARLPSPRAAISSAGRSIRLS